MIKKLLCSILIVVFIFSSVPFSSAYGASDTMTTLVSLVNKFPQGKYWNHVGKSNDPNGITSTPCVSHYNCHWAVNSCDCNSFDNAIQCMGYAHKISYEITGVMPRNNYVKHTTLKASELRVGDIIRYRWNGHSICVTGVNGNKISFTDCNFIGRCQIRWDIMDLSEIVGFSYVLRLKGNERKNSDLDFYENVDGYISGVDTKPNFETWRTKDSNINIRSTRKTSANIIGKIPADTEINIFDKYYDGEYIWGKVVYGDVMGWCVLNYSEYVEGIIESPNIKKINEIYDIGQNIKIQWSEVSGATKYIVAVFNSVGTKVKRYVVGRQTTEKNIQLNTPDRYTVKVVATSSITPSWKINSKIHSFEVVRPQQKVDVESVTFTIPDKIANGSSITLEAVVEPAWATDCSVKWKSSNTSVATINSNGTLTAKKTGEVTITCTSADDSNISYSKKITVVPGKVKNPTQSSSSTKSLVIKWSKVSGAESYEIYIYNSETDKYEKKATSKTNSYTLSLPAGKTYKAKVRAVSKISSKIYYGEYSDDFTVVSGPAVPKLTAKASGKKAVLTWSKASGATQYVIYKINGTQKLKIATVNADDTDFIYVVSDLESGSYTYKIRAIRQDDGVKGYGSYSKAAVVTIK